jgi:hypothetical protein
MDKAGFLACFTDGAFPQKAVAKEYRGLIETYSYGYSSGL